MTFGLLFDDSFKEHFAQYSHPECPERLDAVTEGFRRNALWEAAKHFAPRPAKLDELTLVHDRTYVTRLLQIFDQHKTGNLDPDTFFSKGTKVAALGAAGGGIDLATAVHNREIDWGWALVRPPGHHADKNNPKGFCIFNNIAIAAAAILDKTDAKKIAIFDWDVHHGNGTQDLFWNNPNILFVSVHQWPHFPGSGLSEEIGGLDALGKTVNLPFPSGSQNGDFLFAIDKIADPLFSSFKPDHIMISAGFDAHKNEPLANMELDADCFGLMASKMKTLANKLCDGRITLFLEGGYDLPALADCTESVCLGLNEKIPPDNPPNSRFKPTASGLKIIESTLKAIRPHWPEAL